MAIGAQETEIKYEAADGTELPRFDELPQVARTREAPDEQLDADYFDTRDRRLLAAGITLRRRRGGHDAGWHLKLPAGAHTRREISVPLGAADEPVPDELAKLVLVHTRGRSLTPVARIRTRRTRLLLLDDAGESLAEVASDQVTARAAGRDGRSSRWHEVEFELTGGDAGLLAAADRLLRRDGLIRASQAPKLARALDLPEPASVPAPRPDASAPAGQVIVGYLAGQVAALKAVDPMVRAGEPDSVHQMRTTVRRLRSTLRSFARLLRPRAAEPLAAELRWFGAVLGAARDAEVLQAHLAERLGEIAPEQVIGPVEARVRAHFADQRQRAEAGMLEALDSARYFALLDRLDALAAEPAHTARAGRPARDVLPAAVRRSYARTRRRMARAGSHPAGEDREAALHQARKAAKRARYAGEAVAPALGRDARRLAGQMKRLQSALGEHQDAVIACRAERDLGVAAHLAGENAFTYGVMYGRDSARAELLASRAERVWRKASRGRYRRWLR